MPAPSSNDSAARGSESRVCVPQEGARVLIAGVGYRNLRDLSVGPILMDRLKKEEWPPGFDVEDLSYGPVGVMHNLDDRPAYDKIIVLGGVKRHRRPGQIHCYRWRHELPNPDEIQARMGEAVTGVISLDNLLILATYFKKLPEDVVVIELEPADETWGEGFSPLIDEAIPGVVELIRKQAGVS